jgi:hypothetical protein
MIKGYAVRELTDIAIWQGDYLQAQQLLDEDLKLRRELAEQPGLPPPCAGTVCWLLPAARWRRPVATCGQVSGCAVKSALMAICVKFSMLTV